MSEEASAIGDFIQMELQHGPGVIFVSGGKGAFRRVQDLQPEQFRKHVADVVDADDRKHIVVVYSTKEHLHLYLRDRREALEAS